LIFSAQISILAYTKHMQDIAMTINDAIIARRSFKPADMDPSKEVSTELLLELFECANWAPTHGLTEPWRFEIFQGDSRQRLANAMQAAYITETPEAEFKPEKCEKMAKNPLLAHTIAVIVMKRDATGKIPEIEEIEAVACAVQNLHISASAQDLGVFWSSPTVVYGEGIANFLELQKGDRCLGLLYIGWPAEAKKWPESRRGSVEEKLKWHK